MAKLTDLPTEVLHTIVRSLDNLYQPETDLTIFNIARVNRRLMGIAIEVHFNLVRPSVQPTSDLYRVESSGKWDDEKWKEMFTKMIKHERCYLNYTRVRAREAHERAKRKNESKDREVQRKNHIKLLKSQKNRQVLCASADPTPQGITADITESG